MRDPASTKPAAKKLVDIYDGCAGAFLAKIGTGYRTVGTGVLWMASNGTPVWQRTSNPARWYASHHKTAKKICERRRPGRRAR